MRGSREAPNWVWRAQRGRWAKVPLSGGGGDDLLSGLREGQPCAVSYVVGTLSTRV